MSFITRTVAIYFRLNRAVAATMADFAIENKDEVLALIQEFKSIKDDIKTEAEVHNSYMEIITAEIMDVYGFSSDGEE